LAAGFQFGKEDAKTRGFLAADGRLMGIGARLRLAAQGARGRSSGAFKHMGRGRAGIRDKRGRTMAILIFIYSGTAGKVLFIVSAW